MSFEGREGEQGTVEGLLEQASRAAEKGDLKRAALLCGRAVELDPNNAEAHFALGWLAVGEDDLDQVIACMGRAIACRTDYQEAEYFLGVAYQKKGQRDLAIRHLRRALELDPDDEDAQERLAELTGEARREEGPPEDIPIETEAENHAAEPRSLEAGLVAKERRELKREAARLDRRWQRMRDRLGEDLWKRLRWWKKARDLAMGMSFLGAVGGFVALCVTVGRVVSNLWRGDPALSNQAGTSLLLVGLGIAVTVAGWVVERSFERRIAGALVENGIATEPDDMEVLRIEEALEAQDEARELGRGATGIAKERVAEKLLVQERKRAGHWWRRELSGAHLIWWVSVAAVVAQAEFHAHIPEWVMLRLVYPVFAFGIAWKGLVMVFGLLALGFMSDRTRVVLMKYSRWWAKEPVAVIIALAPALIALGLLAVGR